MSEKKPAATERPAASRDPHGLVARITRPFARKGILRLGGGGWLVWGETRDGRIANYYFTEDGQPDLVRVAAVLTEHQWTTRFEEAKTVDDVRGHQVGMQEFLMTKLLPAAASQVDAWWENIIAEHESVGDGCEVDIRVQLDLRGPHDETLTLRGPANVRRMPNGRLGLYDASKVRAELYDAIGRRVPLCPFDDIKSLGRRVPNAERKKTEVWIMFDQFDICAPQLVANLY